MARVKRAVNAQKKRLVELEKADVKRVKKMLGI